MPAMRYATLQAMLWPIAAEPMPINYRRCSATRMPWSTQIYVQGVEGLIKGLWDLK